MKPTEIKELIKATYAAYKEIQERERIPKLFIVGSPGCGKTQVTYQVFQEIQDPLYVIQAMLYDPVEIKGLPVYKDGVAKFIRFEDMPRDEKGCLFIDDLVHAPNQTQNALMRLVLEGKCGSWDLGGLMPIAAGNRATDRAGAKDMQTAIANRFMRIEFTIDYDDWREVAVKRNFAPQTIAFLGSYGRDWLDKFDAGQQVNPTPRSWEYASFVMKNIPNNLRREALYGCIGQEATSKFLGWLKVYDKLPDLQKIIAGKDIFPEELDVMYAVVSGLVAMAAELQPGKPRKGMYQRLINYSCAMPDKFKELGVWLSKDLYKLDSQIFSQCSLEGYRDKYAEVIL